MQKYYDRKRIAEIEANVNLVDYIGSQIELKKVGNAYFGHCPRHEDHTPSFSIDSAQNFYYCFSCQSGGKIIQYLMDYEKLTFPSAVQKASMLSGLDLSGGCTSDTVNWLRLVSKGGDKKVKDDHAILQLSALDRYKDEPAQEWVDEGISADTQKIFGIRIDTFADRIIYPVYKRNGDLINVKGRTRYADYKDRKIPKYINYYPVGSMDYFQSLNITEPYIHEAGEVIVFEGIKSVMKAWQWGYRNCVAVESHGISPDQERVLLSLGVNIIFAYDSDINYNDKSIRKTLNRLKNLTNVYILEDRDGLLGGAEAKKSPVDCGKDVFELLLENKKVQR